MYRFNGGVSNIQSDVKTVVGNTNALKDGIVKGMQSGFVSAKSYTFDSSPGKVQDFLIASISEVDPNKTIVLSDTVTEEQRETSGHSMVYTYPIVKNDGIYLRAIGIKYDNVFSIYISNIQWQILELY